LAAFSQFGSDLDKVTLAQLNRGQRLVEILKQPQYQPMPVEKQVVIIWTASKGHLDDIPVDELHRFESELFDYLDINAPEVLRDIKNSGKLPNESEEVLKTNILGFKEQFKTTLSHAVGA
jgi:F-type H+-transporting ATPase subunit alpha